MLKPDDYQTMKHAVEKHGDEFWQASEEGDHNIFLLEDIEAALRKEGYELVLVKKKKFDYGDAHAVQRFVITCEHVAQTEADIISEGHEQEVIDELVCDGNYFLASHNITKFESKK